MRSTAPAAQITARRTLSWSSGAAHPQGGTSGFPPSLRRSTASKGRFLIPLVVPEQAQLEQELQGRPAISPGTREMAEQAKTAVDAATLQRQRVESLCIVLENENKEKNKRRLNNVEVELAATQQFTTQIAQVETRVAVMEAMTGQEHQTGGNFVNMEKWLAALENTGTVELHKRRNIEVQVETIQAERKQDRQQSSC